MVADLGGAFCLVCGDPPPLFTDGMCEGCSRARTHLVEVPANIPWTRCARCGAIEVEGRWGAMEEEALFDDLVQRYVKVHQDAQDVAIAMMPQPITERHTLLHLEVEGVIDDLLYTEQHTVRARMSNGVCLTCTRRAGNYFEATVQLRSSGRRLEDDELTKLRSTLDDVLASMPEDPMFFITKEGPVQGGYDVVLGSKGLARSWGRHLTTTFGGQSIETNSTVGRKDGVDVTRLTLLYRKPGYDLGDVVRWRDRYWRPSAWTKDGAILEAVDRHERTGATWRDLEPALVSARMKDLVAVEPLSEDASVAEVLDPTTWSMESVRVAWDHEAGRTMVLARIDGEWLALPRSAQDKDLVTKTP